MDEPQVSVLMAVRNGLPYVRESIESIRGQSLREIEFIIVDDASTDGTAEFLRTQAKGDPRLVVVRNDDHWGLTRSLNRGLRLVQGEFVARQDADDVSAPDRLARQLAFLRSHPEFGLAGSAYHVIDAEAERTATHCPPVTDTEIRWQMLFHNAFCHSSVVLRRATIDHGPLLYDESLPFSQDYDLWARLLSRTRATNLRDPLVSFRTHSGSIQRTRGDAQRTIASRVSAGQMSALLARPLPLPDVEKLRDWFYRCPASLRREELRLCEVLWDMMAAFGGREGIDSEIYRRIRARWVDRMLSAIPLSMYGCPQVRDLLGQMMRAHAPDVAVHFLRRSSRRMRAMAARG
jgi:hypothetical protein